jgi:hypothetical protein
MQFDAKFFTILVFVVINFFILFIVKTRTTLVISVIITHLIAILFFSLSIVNYDAFKEITLSLILYSMVILFLISNYGTITVNDEDSGESRRHIFFNGVICVIAAAVFLLLINVVKNVGDSRKSPVFMQEQGTKISDYNSMKKARMRDKLLDNFLLKRSSDVILIIVAASTTLLLLSRKEK